MNHIMNTIREARAKNSLFKYFLDTSTHTLTNILPAYVEDPPAQCQIIALNFGAHSLPSYAFPQDSPFDEDIM